jgi:hypothetical protein
MIDIEKIRQRQQPTVNLPEWGCQVTVVPLKASVAGPLFARINSLRQDDGVIPDGEQSFAAYADLLSVSIRDADGDFPFASDEGRRFLVEQPIGITHRLVRAAMQANGISAEVTEEKNSATSAPTGE